MSTAFKFTLDEYDRMIDQEIFDPARNQRTELIYGEVREMTPPGPFHEDVIDILTRWSTKNTNEDVVRIRVQNSVGISELDSAPQPDIAWVNEQSYRSGRPQVADVLLIIEVSNTSLAYDRGKKATLYAEAGIADYWIVNLQDLQIEILRDPSQGAFQSVHTATAGETVSPLRLPSVKLSVSALFGN